MQIIRFYIIRRKLPHMWLDPEKVGHLLITDDGQSDVTHFFAGRSTRRILTHILTTIFFPQCGDGSSLSFEKYLHIGMRRDTEFLV